MKLRDISYELLMIARGSHITDDDRIDLRLLESFIKQYREDYIVNLNRVSKMIPEVFVQSTIVPLEMVTTNSYKTLESVDIIPKLVTGRFGPLIAGIYSDKVMEFSYTIVNRNQLRFSGNGRFNGFAIFVSYFNNKLNFKYIDDGFNLMTDVDLAAVFANPSIVPGFDEDVDDFPLDLSCVNFIKDAFFKSELKLLLQLPSDEVNSADGKVEE